MAPRALSFAGGDRVGGGRSRLDPPPLGTLPTSARRRAGPRTGRSGHGPGVAVRPPTIRGCRASGLGHHAAGRHHRVRREPGREVPDIIPCQLRQRPGGIRARSAAVGPATGVSPGRRRSSWLDNRTPRRRLLDWRSEIKETDPDVCSAPRRYRSRHEHRARAGRVHPSRTRLHHPGVTSALDMREYFEELVAAPPSCPPTSGPHARHPAPTPATVVRRCGQDPGDPASLLSPSGACTPAKRAVRSRARPRREYIVDKRRTSSGRAHEWLLPRGRERSRHSWALTDKPTGQAGAALAAQPAHSRVDNYAIRAGQRDPATRQPVLVVLHVDLFNGHVATPAGHAAARFDWHERSGNRRVDTAPPSSGVSNKPSNRPVGTPAPVLTSNLRPDRRPVVQPVLCTGAGSVLASPWEPGSHVLVVNRPGAKLMSGHRTTSTHSYRARGYARPATSPRSGPRTGLGADFRAAPNTRRRLPAQNGLD